MTGLALLAALALVLALWRSRRLQAEIARRQATEQALRAQHDLLATVFDATTDAILILDDSFRVLAANSTAAQRFGHDVAALRGQDILALTESEVASTRLERYREALDTGRPLCFRDCRAGRVYDNTLHPLPASPGSQARLTIYARDVTEELAVGQAVRESREQLAKIFRLTPAVISITSTPEGRFLDVNETFTTITGLARQDALGRTVEELGLWLDPHDRERIMQGVAASGLVRNLEIQFHRLEDGRIATGLLSCIPLEAYGRPCQLSVMVDITERKAMEQALLQAKEAAEAASQAKTRFLSVMSHEVRTPMNTILGMVDVLRDTELSRRQREFLDALEGAGESLMALLEAILDVSRIESGTLSLTRQAYDPGELARQGAAAYASRAAAKGLSLSVEVAPDVGNSAWGDPARIRQILGNLLDNAVKFTDVGEVRLELARSPADGVGGELRFSVIDTGIGIPPEMRQAVFEPFTLLDASTTRTRGGAGLGLALCAMLARSLGGRLTLASAPGRGSAFHFFLPSNPPQALPEEAGQPEISPRAWTTPPVTD